MKKAVRFLFAVVFSLFVFSALAQEEVLLEAESKTDGGDNWFISLGVSANLMMAEQDNAYPLGKRITYGESLTLGKWFNYGFGVRLQANGGFLRGARASSDCEQAFSLGNDFFQEFNYGQVSIDLMLNLTNLIRRSYQENHFFDLVPYAGIGVFTGLNNKYTDNFYRGVMKLGVRTNFNLNPNWSIYLEPQINVANLNFNSYKRISINNILANLSLGVQYTFSKGSVKFKRYTSEEVESMNEAVNENRSPIETSDLLDNLQKNCDEKTSLPRYIRFPLNSDKIDQSEQHKMIDIINYLKNTPDANILLVGYADKKTGNPKYNWELSHKRVDAVIAELERSEIDSSRLIIDWKGDKEQPYTENEWNRAVIIVESN
jgi:outer membrane protein OmpA-like peptidoglycan-associated protein